MQPTSTPPTDPRPTTEPATPVVRVKPASTFGRWLSLLLLTLIALSLLGGLALYWRHSQPAPVETISREGVISKIQTLNRLQTVVYNVDTVITSQKEGNWYALWQDHQKALFVAHGRVQAGIDLSQLTPTNVQVEPETRNVTITLPPAQVLETYLDNIEVYDINTGLFNMFSADPQLFAQAQTVGKRQVLSSACRTDILKLATDNAQKQVQSLFALADLNVIVNTVPPKACAS